ncbi:hypothetical protein BANRA_04000 [Escherichia coli]|uniref:Uncharacterized protein n=1 Tax=Escherichia coli TaxID=562 RepID=A0A3P5DMN2_ECOLX|nr:hypothetical protein BANRA_04000 [Escherichia coli]VCY82203.1 hypothetical protein BANRA_00837 [Escherichia coli]VCZ22934.1 hypothetical protein BANRA_02097 [Escherichia coli]
MREQIKQDIDLIEILFYLKKRFVLSFYYGYMYGYGAVVSVYQ